jgi:hypothetical protein
MVDRAVVLALALSMPAMLSSGGAPARHAQREPAWLRTESPHFEIHHPREFPADLASLIPRAERAYERISTRLNFTLATKVPLVLFAPDGPFTQDQVVAYATSDRVAPHHPHRSRIVLPLGDEGLDARIVHELTHLLVAEIVLPQAPGTGGVPRWVHEGIASHMVGTWSAEHERLVREVVATTGVPALSRLVGDGGFTNPRVNDAFGQLAFDYIERRWGAGGLRRFIDALIVPRTDTTYAAVLGLTPAEFDAAFRADVERRFGRGTP